MTVFKILFSYQCEESTQIEKEKRNSVAVNIRMFNFLFILFYF